MSYSDRIQPLRESVALSVIGRAANSIGPPADISASSDGQVLRRSGSVLGFGADGPVSGGVGVFKSPACTTVGTFLGISGTAYFVFLGLVRHDFTPTYVKFHVTTKGAGAQTAEVGFFSSPAAPNNAGQTLTKLVADGTVDSLTASDGVIRGNTSAMATSISAGVFLWAGVRTAMATTQPTYAGLRGDISLGCILSLAGADTFTSGTTYAADAIAISASANCPDLRGLV